MIQCCHSNKALALPDGYKMWDYENQLSFAVRNNTQGTIQRTHHLY